MGSSSDRDRKATDQAAQDSGIGRREFLRQASVQTGLAVAAAKSLSAEQRIAAPSFRTQAATDIVVIGAGIWGTFISLNLQQMGHQVTLVDAYGPGNIRSTSGDETRGVRTGYEDNELWTRWASESIRMWEALDAEWGTRLFTKTSDLAMRSDWDGFLTLTRQTWEKLGIRHEVLDHDEMAYRWPQIDFTGMNVGLYEPDAGVGRARIACLTVAEQFRKAGGEVMVSRAEMGASTGGRLQQVRLDNGSEVGGQTFVFALGPWFPKFFPEVIGDLIKIPMGHVYYYGTPPQDDRFMYPNIPSFNVPGTTGWPALPFDNQGFRVRTGGRPPEDPDFSTRWIAEEFHERPRDVLRAHFPALADMPLVKTHSCHYESSASQNFIIAPHPGYQNVWIAGGGSAEGFKFAPKIGEYVAERVTGINDDPVLNAAFAIPAQPTDGDW